MKSYSNQIANVPSKKKAKKIKKISSSVVQLFIVIFVSVAIIFSSVVIYLHYNDAIMALKKERSTLVSQIKKRKTEISRLSIQKEELRQWDYIKSKLTEYKINLIERNPERIISLKRSESNDYIPSYKYADLRNSDMSSDMTM